MGRASTTDLHTETACTAPLMCLKLLTTVEVRTQLMPLSCDGLLGLHCKRFKVVIFYSPLSRMQCITVRWSDLTVVSRSRPRKLVHQCSGDGQLRRTIRKRIHCARCGAHCSSLCGAHERFRPCWHSSQDHCLFAALIGGYCSGYAVFGPQHGVCNV